MPSVRHRLASPAIGDAPDRGSYKKGIPDKLFSATTCDESSLDEGVFLENVEVAITLGGVRLCGTGPGSDLGAKEKCLSRWPGLRAGVVGSIFLLKGIGTLSWIRLHRSSGRRS